MQSFGPRFYFCHPCQKTITISTLELLCPVCGSDFLQEAKMPDVRSDVLSNDSRPAFRVNLSNLTNRHAFFARVFEEFGQNRPESGNNIQDIFRHLLINFQGMRPSDSDSEDEEVHVRREIVEKDENDDCKICTANFLKGEEKSVLECNHQYHVQCLEPWLKIKHWCPFCRHRI